MHDRELHALAFDQHAVAVATDGAKVYEDIVAGVARDKAEAFRGVEPLDGAGIALAAFLCSAASIARAAAAAAEADARLFTIALHSALIRSNSEIEIGNMLFPPVLKLISILIKDRIS